MNNKNNQFPECGFLTLKDIIGCKKAGTKPIIPVGRTTWNNGVKSGIYPKPHKLGPRLNGWAVEDIMALLERLKSK